MDGIFHATYVSARMYWARLRLIESVLLDENGRKLVMMLPQCFLGKFVFGKSLLDVGLITGRAIWGRHQIRVHGFTITAQIGAAPEHIEGQCGASSSKAKQDYFQAGYSRNGICAVLFRHVRSTIQRRRDIRSGCLQAASDQSLILRDNFLHRGFSAPDE